MLTGWDFARSGKKAASLSPDLVLKVSNTEARRIELIPMIGGAIENGRLEKNACLTLGG